MSIAARRCVQKGGRTDVTPSGFAQNRGGWRCGLLVLAAVLTGAGWLRANAQGTVGYQLPPEEIRALADMPPTPQALLDPRNATIAYLHREPYESLAWLSRPDLRLAGLRVDPANAVAHTITLSDNRPIRLDPAHALSIQRIGTDPSPVAISGLPAQARLAHVIWSPDGRHLAFVQVAADRAELWVADAHTMRARRLLAGGVNATLGNPLVWFRDGQALLVKVQATAKPRVDAQETLPEGPLVQESGGRKVSNRTFQDLLRSAADERQFEAMASSRLMRVPLRGRATHWAGPGLYRDLRFSPDGSLLLAETLQRPFSHRAPLDRFPLRHTLLDRAGKELLLVSDRPLSEALPRGRMAVPPGRRNIDWRADAPATLVWFEALDGGDPAHVAPSRDALVTWDAPFEEPPRTLLETKNRLREVLWGTAQDAVARDEWWDTRETRVYAFAPDGSQPARVLIERDLQDAASDPGVFSRQAGRFAEPVLRLEQGHAWLVGNRVGADGEVAFLDRIDLHSGNRSRTYQSAPSAQVETAIAQVGEGTGSLLLRIESPVEQPDYHLRRLEPGVPGTRLTHFGPLGSPLAGVTQRVLPYTRGDGLSLGGMLYLPAQGCDSDRKLPLLIWAYPVEYKTRSSAAQTAVDNRRFPRLDFKSPVFWAARGYAVLDQAAFPIIGEGDSEPNDTYLPQLKANARAAIDAAVELGCIDPARIAVGGHSYGAFMVANLLTHTDWFAAGIARSGAYNRTLTPFGFQREERSLWEAPEAYLAMSPFLHAETMKTPLLLIHGQEDGNAATQVMQSERYFAALGALGAPARLVLLPQESHSYLARESVMHVLWEQDQWLERYLASCPTSAPARERVEADGSGRCAALR